MKSFLSSLGVAGLLGIAQFAFADVPKANGSALAAANVMAALPPPSSSEQTVAVFLRTPPLSLAYADSVAKGTPMSDSAQRAYTASLLASQNTLASQLANLGARKLANLTASINAVVVAINSSKIAAVSRFAAVRSVQTVKDYATSQMPTDYKPVVPWVGAAAARANGIDGHGVRVAVLDTGIDYTHAAFGGLGTEAAYLAAYGSSPSAAANKSPVTWPQGIVVGGYDFVGETWPNDALAPDPNPIGAPSAGNIFGFATDGSHGTSVADIIAGQPFPAQPNNHGIAPGASLYAVKVCSAVGTSCSGVAILEGLDFALDPNGDGSISDHVDVVNLSLGANYGLREDPSTEATANAARAGIIVCAAAGNAGDNPYIVSSPALAPEVIGVAQITSPDTVVYRVDFSASVGAPATFSIKNTNTVEWAPLTSKVTAQVVQPDAAGLVTQKGCAASNFVNVAGKIVVIDRGTCNISFKIAYAESAGAVGVILANNGAGDPPSFSYGGLPPDVDPSLVISIPLIVVTNLDGAALKARIHAGGTVTGTLDPAAFTATAQSIVSTSSRGPSVSYQGIKPEIGATGASPAAVAGTGTSFAIFGGTSGATPVISGAAALLRQAFPGISVLEAKARLMNNAEPVVYANPVTQPGVLTPISRSGAGELRVSRALAATAALWSVPGNGQSDIPTLAFGYSRINTTQTFTKTVRLKNYAAATRTFTLSQEVRTAPGTPGAVTLTFPPNVTVPAGGTTDFVVTLVVDASKLPTWNTASGVYGNDGPRFTGLEFGGYVKASDAIDTLRIPYDLIPHKAHRAVANSSTFTIGGPMILFSNAPSFLDALAIPYSLVGTSPRLPPGSYPAAGDGYVPTDIQNVGARLVDYGGTTGLVLEILVSAYDRHVTINYPSSFEVDLDLDNDGVADWILFHQEASSSDVRNVTYLAGAPWASGFGTFYTTADFNSNVVVLSVPLNRLTMPVPTATPASAPVFSPGLSPTTPISFTVIAWDNALSGYIFDEVGPIHFTPGAPRYLVNAGLDPFTVTSGGSVPVTVTDTGTLDSPSQTGLLFRYDSARTNAETTVLTRHP